MKYCNFCDKAQDESFILIAGPGDIYICEECSTICNEIVRKKTVSKLRELKVENQNLKILNNFANKVAFTEFWGAN